MSDSQSTLKTLSGLSDTLARVVGLLVGLSGLAYFVGYRIESHYLSQAGASWVLGHLSTSEIIREGQVVILAVGFTLFLSIINIFERNTSSEKLKQKDLIFSCISFALLGAAYLTSKYWDNYALDYGLSILAGIIWAAAAGFTIGELIVCLNESKRNWNEYHLKLLFFAYISAIASAPYFIGSNKANLDLEPKVSTLPVVTITGEEAGKWHLMRTVGDNYLLVTLVEKPAAREFRLVPISPTVVISSTRIK